MLRPCALAAHIDCYAGYVANTSARCTGLVWGGVGHEDVMYACVTYETLLCATSMSKQIVGVVGSVNIQMCLLRSPFHFRD